jgi:hypothetical protein
MKEKTYEEEDLRLMAFVAHGAAVSWHTAGR